MKNEEEKAQVLNENGCFSFMAGMISDMFSNVSISRLYKDQHGIRKGEKEIKHNIAVQLAFLDSKEVAAFCDCSDNFMVEKLKKEFLQKATAACGI